MMWNVRSVTEAERAFFTEMDFEHPRLCCEYLTQAGSWLEREPDFSMENGMSIHLEHDLVEIPEVVVGIITHTIKRRKGITPGEMSWRVTPL